MHIRDGHPFFKAGTMHGNYSAGWYWPLLIASEHNLISSAWQHWCQVLCYVVEKEAKPIILSKQGKIHKGYNYGKMRNKWKH